MLSENYTLLLLGSNLIWKLEPIIAHLITHQMNDIFNENEKSFNMCRISSSCISIHVAK